MKLAIFSSSSNSSGDRSGKSKKTGKKKSRSLSRSDPPSFGSGSSSSSSDPSTTPTTVLSRPHTQTRPRPLVIGRNASCLDAEYWVPSPKSVTDVFADSELRLGEDGKLTKKQLEDALLRLGNSKLDELPEIFDAADQDGDGRISLEELLTLLRPKQKEIDQAIVDDEEEELRAAFEVYDANGDGKISAEELHEVLQQLGDKSCSVDDCRRMIGVVDSDGDGLVCFNDFSRMMAINGHR